MGIVSLDRVRHALGAFVAAGVVMSAVAGPAAAQTIIDEWASVEVPPPPTVDPVEVDAKTTAVLVLDFLKQICNSERTPRCVASVPKVATLLTAARGAGSMVVYSRFGGTTDADIVPALAPQSGDPVVSAGPDKFLGSDLEQTLKDKGITTVIVTGIAANGAVLYTASHAAFTGMDVIVPVDGMSAGNPYAEQYVAWNMVNAPGTRKVKLATLGGITFK
jgi:nicotinamidase-related amidase